jgi:hypothetical protein
MEDFEFDDINFEIDEADLKEMDKQFINSIQNTSNNSTSCDSDSVFSFWLLIVLLIFFIVCIAFMFFFISRGRSVTRQRAELGI